METFYRRIGELSHEQRRAVLTNIIAQMRQHQQHPIADAFYDILSCYPEIPIFKGERNFRLYLAWPKLFQLQDNPLVNQIVNQPI
jgi:hypothetical protein